MKTTFCLLLLILLTALGFGLTGAGQNQEPADGRNQILHDEFLNNLAGDWKLARKIRGHNVQNSAHAEWVLNHQFLFIHMKPAGDVHMKPAGDPSQYEAMIYIGYDNAGQCYVAHWIDIFGGRVSETLGYGKRNGNSIQFVFEYSDGTFHNTFTWNQDTKSWASFMEQKDNNGKWATFAEDTYRRS